jgi:hypothetical protein
MASHQSESNAELVVNAELVALIEHIDRAVAKADGVRRQLKAVSEAAPTWGDSAELLHARGSVLMAIRLLRAARDEAKAALERRE